LIGALDDENSGSQTVVIRNQVLEKELENEQLLDE
jgi:hypothetical protein